MRSETGTICMWNKNIHLPMEIRHENVFSVMKMNRVSCSFSFTTYHYESHKKTSVDAYFQ